MQNLQNRFNVVFSGMFCICRKLCVNFKPSVPRQLSVCPFTRHSPTVLMVLEAPAPGPHCPDPYTSQLESATISCKRPHYAFPS